MKKSNSLLSKAINEAETIRAGAMKNAHEILFNTFQPKIKSLFNEVLKEQVGVVNQDPMDGPNPSKYDQDKAEADLQNPANALHGEGSGPELLEDEDFDNPDEIPEQDDEEFEVGDEIPEQDDEELSFEDIPEQGDEEAVDDFEIPEQDDDYETEGPVAEQGDEEVNDDFEIPEQDDEEAGEDFEIPEQDDEEAGEDFEIPEQDDEEVDDFEIPEQGDEDIEVVDDEVEEQTDVNPSLDQDVKKLANENRFLKSKVNNLSKRNKELAEGVNYLRRKIAEVSLFNTKVGAANKITSYKGLSEGQKIKMLEAFDKCRNIREVKLTYTNFKNFVRSLEDKKRVSESRNYNKIQRTLNSKNVNRAKSSEIMSEEQRKTLKLAGILS